jgi:hypothetical protein
MNSVLASFGGLGLATRKPLQISPMLYSIDVYLIYILPMDEALEKLVVNCPRLKNLSVTVCDKIDDIRYQFGSDLFNSLYRRKKKLLTAALYLQNTTKRSCNYYQQPKVI